MFINPESIIFLLNKFDLIAMDLIVFIAAILTSLYFIISLFIHFGLNRSVKTDNHQPSVSIIIAARNEEHNIKSCLDSIEKLVGEDGLYPSRSELIRVAVREFLLKELALANRMAKYKESEIKDFDEKNYVRVPIETTDENDEPVREFKTYKIVRRLEY